MDAKTFQLATGVSAQLAEQWASPVTAAMLRFQIDTPNRQAAFLAQIGHESNGFTQLRESLNYTVAGLRKTFGDRITPSDAYRLGRKDGEPALPEARQMAIANIVYGGRFGNNTMGDGWRYRGGGLKQITFRSNYADCGYAIGVDLVGQPELITTPDTAALSAGWFWQANRCNSIIDRGDFEALTRRINGGLNGLAERTVRWERAKTALGVK
ncbi:glycoside hydrolase family 19 protein [Luteibacter sp. PPL201]|uniref:Glycoside hydrolase family 19 protein n=1 Tax=Luteibacter sahnii TaxID=3021977 RepID=A0ABT6B839_9GAMM